MNNQYAIWIIVAVLIVLGLLASWLTAGSWGSSFTATTTPTGEPTTQTPPKNTGGTSTVKPTVPKPVEKVYSSGLLSIYELMKLMNATYSCTFSVASPYRAGTFQLATNKWRGEFSNGVSMINDGKYIYLWSKGETDGLQVVATSAVVGNALVQKGGIDIYTPLNYKCGTWTLDASRFTPPQGITFKNTEGYILQ